MARFRRRRAGMKGRPAGAFAGAMRSGRTLAWESLSVSHIPAILPTSFPTVSNVAGGVTTRLLTLVPENVTRGAVTLERIRGNVFVMWAHSATFGNNGINFIPVPMNIQLVPVANGVLALNSVLDPANAADLESNRILWRQTWYPDFAMDAGTLVAGTRFFAARQPLELDVKVKRHFDRATWALTMVVRYPTVEEVFIHAGLDIRALFRTPDGL